MTVPSEPVTMVRIIEAVHDAMRQGVQVMEVRLHPSDFFAVAGEATARGTVAPKKRRALESSGGFVLHSVQHAVRVCVDGTVPRGEIVAGEAPIAPYVLCRQPGFSARIDLEPEPVRRERFADFPFEYWPAARSTSCEPSSFAKPNRRVTASTASSALRCPCGGRLLPAVRYRWYVCNVCGRDVEDAR
jgi:DNA-directed RNA polymerase subunit RPC12/RpoP